jgi:hypothetical protein
MNTRTVLALGLAFNSLAFVAVAADLPPVPSDPIAKKKELLFSDDFESTSPNKLWHKVVPTFAFEKGTLKGTQMRDKNVPAADGKPAATAHAAVHGLELPTKDSIVEAKIRLDGASFVSVEFDDRKYTGAHYGHICLAQVRTNGVTIVDQKDGNMRNDIYAMSKDPEKKAERAALLKGRQITYPAKVSSGEWHTLIVETVGDEMRVVLDGKPAAFLKSSGIGHPTKSKIELGCGGKDGYFDDIKVWNAEPVKR